MLSHILEPNAQLVSHLLVRCGRQANTSRVSQSLQARGDVDAVPIKIFMLDDHIAQIDADPKRNTPSACHGFIAIGHSTLDIGCAPDRIDNTYELNQQAIPGRLHTSAGEAMYG